VVQPESAAKAGGLARAGVREESELGKGLRREREKIPCSNGHISRKNTQRRSLSKRARQRLEGRSKVRGIWQGVETRPKPTPKKN